MTTITRTITNEHGNEIEVKVSHTESSVEISLGYDGNEVDRDKLQCTRLEAKTISELLQLLEPAYKDMS